MKHFFTHSTKIAFVSMLALAGNTAHAQTGSLNTQPIVNLSNSIIGLLNTVVVPFVFAVAFLIFIWGVYTYFIAGGASEEKRAEGQKFVLSGIVGFALMVSVWGIVNIITGTFPGLKGAEKPPLPCFSGNCQASQQNDQNLCPNGNCDNLPY